MENIACFLREYSNQVVFLATLFSYSPLSILFWSPFHSPGLFPQGQFANNLITGSCLSSMGPDHLPRHRLQPVAIFLYYSSEALPVV